MTALAQARAAARPWPDRVLAAVPLLTAFAWLCLVYAWLAWSLGTPWLFTDELEHTQLARSIAESGEPARRGVSHPFGTLYVFLTAPAWWIDDTQTAYEVAKYIGVVVMTSAIFPAYALARLLASPAPALFAATATIATPAFMYSGMLMQEPLAYPYAVLCFYLIVKALALRTRRWIVAAVVAAAVAPFVRGELAVIVPLFALAASWIAWQSERARRWRRGWSSWDWAGAALIVAGAALFASEVLSHRSQAWFVSWRYWEERMLDLAADAAGALTIGLGVLPVVAGLTALARPRGEEARPAVQAFSAVFLSALLVFSLYTAVKAAFLSTNYGTRVPERNLIYLAPLLLVGTALWLERRAVRWWALAVAAGATLLVLATTALQLDYPYFEAPGFIVASLANRELGWAQSTIESALLLVLAAAVALVAAPSLLARRSRLAGATGAVAAVLVLAWSVTGAIVASRASVDYADRLLTNFPEPVDWVDEATGGEPAVYVAVAVKDATGIWMHEFWNRSIREVWSTDATAPGPGPTVTPDLVSPQGHLAPDKGFDYAVVEPSVDLVGRTVAENRGLRVVQIEPPLRLRSSTVGVSGDGWQGPFSAHSRYETPGNRAGTATVTVSRVNGGVDAPGVARIMIGPLVIGSDKQPHLISPTAIETWDFKNGLEKTFRLRTPPPPFRIEVTVDPVFVPAEVDPRLSDLRQLGAQTTFGFEPGR